jgi:hypothetical protein
VPLAGMKAIPPIAIDTMKHARLEFIAATADMSFPVLVGWRAIHSEYEKMARITTLSGKCVRTASLSRYCLT